MYYFGFAPAKHTKALICDNVDFVEATNNHMLIES